jgi:hypothetical protein
MTKQILWIFAVVALMLMGGKTAHATLLTFQHGDGGLFSDMSATYLEKSNPDSNFGTHVQIQFDSASGSANGLFKFSDLFGNALGQIPLGSTINSANIIVQVANSNAGNDINIHQVLTTWDESTATWNNFSDGGLSGINYVSTALLSTTFGGTNSFKTWNVLTAVQSWSAAADNQGLIILQPTATDRGGIHSDESSTIEGRPLLTVDFTAPISPVPEPSSFVMFSLAGLIAFMRRRRH